MVSCDALVRSGVPFLPGLTTVPQNEEPDMVAAVLWTGESGKQAWVLTADFRFRFKHLEG